MIAKNIPLGVIVLGTLALLFGLGQILSGIFLVYFPRWGFLSLLSGIILILIGVFAAIFGIGCFMQWSWVWMIGIILSVVGILLLLISVLSEARVILFPLDLSAANIGIIAVNVIEILAVGFVIWYLYRPNVKAYFRKSDPV